MTVSIRLFIVGAALLGCVSGTGADPVSFDAVRVVTGSAAGTVEANVAALLVVRLTEMAGVRVDSVPERAASPAPGGLTILLGIPAHHAALRKFLIGQRVAAPTFTDPGGEGLVLKIASSIHGTTLAAAGVDERGVLYAAGEILRRASADGSKLAFPSSLDVRSAPAFHLRGLQVGQGATMVQLMGVKPWTRDQWQRVVLDYALAGANVFGSVTHPEFDFLRSYGLMSVGYIVPNALGGHPEWSAVEPIGRPNFVCPSIPEARAAILKNAEKLCANGLPHDIMRLTSGDPGGCWCDKCAPWGKTYIKVCEDTAKIIHHYNPHAEVYASNQELSNDGDTAVFDHFNHHPDSELSGLYYGPGSNAMSWNGTKRPDHRMDLFDHPAFGVFDRYLREMVHDLPTRQQLTFFTDITHWIASQYGFLVSWPMADFAGATPPPRDFWVYNQQPDRALLQVYNRRTFFVRPRAYYRIFQETERYGEGDITYSEGYHDHFNQWMWQRLLWDPHRTLKDVVNEYCRVWFGSDAAPVMAEAVFQLETNLTAPLATNDGIDRYLHLVTEAGTRIPDAIMKKDCLWRMHMQKALTDKYVQLRLRRQTAVLTQIQRRFGAAQQDHQIDNALSYAQARLKAPAESREMTLIREKIRRFGEESAANFGVRGEGYFKLDQDLCGLGWVQKQVDDAVGGPPESKRALVRLVAHYDDPGEGGFYDDCGDVTRCPHLVRGWPYSFNNLLAGDISGANLPSQRAMAYTADDKQGVTLAYDHLDPTAQYRVRLALVRPRFLARYATRQPEKSESLFANGRLLAKDIQVPEMETQLFEYDIPRDLTSDGTLKVWLEPTHPGPMDGPPADVLVWKRTGGWGTIISDVWLFKK